MLVSNPILCSAFGPKKPTFQLKMYLFSGHTREPREGWPLMTVETESQGDSRSSFERGISSVGSLGSSCSTRDFCPAFAALIGPVKIFFPVHYFSSSCPHYSTSWVVGYSDFHNLMGFTSKKMPNNIL